MTISARIIADSVGPYGNRVTTMELRYPRFIHAEFMTHRVFSRNASSSRAIPVKKLINDVIGDPAMPIHWGKNQKGMQANEELSDFDKRLAKQRWLWARDYAVQQAIALDAIGAHKQVVNRVLEPFSHITVTVTATEWTNFFTLRCHEDAQPEIRVLADAMYAAMQDSTPRELGAGEWHLPYVREEEFRDYTLPISTLIKLSVARCARTSYLTHDKKEPKLEQDLELYERLVGSEPLHASPAEHQCRPDVKIGAGWMNPELHGNLVGWVQYRKKLPNENATTFKKD